MSALRSTVLFGAREAITSCPTWHSATTASAIGMFSSSSEFCRSNGNICSALSCHSPSCSVSDSGETFPQERYRSTAMLKSLAASLREGFNQPVDRGFADHCRRHPTRDADVRIDRNSSPVSGLHRSRHWHQRRGITRYSLTPNKRSRQDKERDANGVSGWDKTLKKPRDGCHVIYIQQPATQIILRTYDPS